MIKGPEEKIYESLSDKKLDDANLKIELLNNDVTSLFEKWQEQKILLSDIRINYEPRFKRFLDLASDLENYSEEQRKAYKKPVEVPRAIIAVCYSRYPKEVWKHFNKKNPLLLKATGLARETKIYYYLGKGGILILEKFLGEAEELMIEVKEKNLGGLYEFRILHSQRYGTGFQLELFRKYIETI